MELEFVETQEEWNFLRGFLSENLQSRGQFKKRISVPIKMKKLNFGSLEKYEHGFWTGGIEKKDGSWMWRIYPRRVDSLDIELEDEIPWSFRNWGWLSHSDDVSVLMFLNEKPYFWWKDSGHQPENLNFFICEKESRQQRTKNALAFMNYLVGTDSYDSELPSFHS